MTNINDFVTVMIHISDVNGTDNNHLWMRLHSQRRKYLEY